MTRRKNCCIAFPVFMFVTFPHGLIRKRSEFEPWIAIWHNVQA